jgi:hypothetical protein
MIDWGGIAALELIVVCVEPFSLVIVVWVRVWVQVQVQVRVWRKG